MSKDIIFNLSDWTVDLVRTPFVCSILERAATYLKAGYPVHFSGPSGAGKTTLAMAAASMLARPAVMIYGNDEFIPSDLIGSLSGFRRRLVYDNFIHSVYKSEEDFRIYGIEGRLTTACREGYTLIYDEFNRSRPETNNILLSILEEGILNIQGVHKDEQYLQVNKNFRAILTSNPEEYAGVHRTQDALQQRLITLYLSPYDRETEIAIGVLRSGLEEESVARVVDFVGALRQWLGREVLSVRSIIRICRLAAHAKAPVSSENSTFVQICEDVLLSDLLPSDGGAGGRDRVLAAIHGALKKYC
ncbi:MAG: gas vesicle protein GvpN [Ammonifex sp.]|jgi:gas vesicle protein GvpN|nr:MAG: gas vesicle protein GvpN [Ammonifex sp.]